MATPKVSTAEVVCVMGALTYCAYIAIPVGKLILDFGIDLSNDIWREAFGPRAEFFEKFNTKATKTVEKITSLSKKITGLTLEKGAKADKVVVEEQAISSDSVEKMMKQVSQLKASLTSSNEQIQQLQTALQQMRNKDRLHFVVLGIFGAAGTVGLGVVVYQKAGPYFKKLRRATLLRLDKNVANLSAHLHHICDMPLVQHSEPVSEVASGDRPDGANLQSDEAAV